MSEKQVKQGKQSKQGKQGKKGPNVDENGTIIIDPPKSVNNKDHFQRLNYLYQIGTFNTLENKSHIGRVLAKKYVHNLDIIGKKTKSNMLPNAKRTICKKCKRILVPSETCTLSMETDSPQNKRTKKETHKRVIKRQKEKNKIEKEKCSNSRSHNTNIPLGNGIQNGFTQSGNMINKELNTDTRMQLLNSQRGNQSQNGYIDNRNVIKKEANSDTIIRTINGPLTNQSINDSIEMSNTNRKNEVFVITCKCGTKKRFKVGADRNYKNFYEKEGVLLDISK